MTERETIEAVTRKHAAAHGVDFMDVIGMRATRKASEARADAWADLRARKVKVYTIAHHFGCAEWSITSAARMRRDADYVDRKRKRERARYRKNADGKQEIV